MSSAVRQFEPESGVSRLSSDEGPRGLEGEALQWVEEARAWLVTGYAEAVRGFREPRLSPAPEPRSLEAERVRALWRVEEGRERMHLRRRAAAGFTPQALDGWQGRIRALVRGWVEGVRSAGRMDVVETLTRRLPPLVMAELLDIPAGDRERFLACAQRLADFQAPRAGMDEAELSQRALAAAQEVLALLTSLVEARRRAPGEDLLSRMMHGPHEASLTPARWVPQVVLFLLAEHACTADLLGNALHVLLVHPEQLRLLRAEPSRMRAAVEEVLRMSPAHPMVRRVATETFSWGGRILRKGDAVLLGVATANRDPSVIADPERFDITRDVYAQKHLSLGFGTHQCLSAGLVRRELEVLLEVLLTVLPDVCLDEERPARLKRTGPLSRGFETLSVRW